MAVQHAPALEAITADPPPWTHRTVLRQRWSELASLHWRYDAEIVQRLLPDGLRVDIHDDSAWVGLIPFEMRDVRIGPTPPVPWVSSFIEINVRTYVIDQLGRRGVWFFSLDVPRSVVVAVARTAFSLPYCRARTDHVVDGDVHRYAMARRWPRHPSPGAEMCFRVGDRVPDDEVSDLDHFLSARWALATTRGEALLRGRVHHPRWPLHEVHDVRIEQDVIQAAGLPAPTGEPYGRYSPGVDVEIAWFEHVDTRRPEQER